MTETEKEIQCLRNAEQYCRERAAMAWSERSRETWRKQAEWNAEQRERRERGSS